MATQDTAPGVYPARGLPGPGRKDKVVDCIDRPSPVCPLHLYGETCCGAHFCTHHYLAL